MQFSVDEVGADRKESCKDRREEGEGEKKACGKYGFHEPDVAFNHIGAKWLGMIIEVLFP